MMYLDSHTAFASPHLLTPSLSNRANFALGTGDLFSTGTAGVTSVIPKGDVKESLLFLLALLNSRLLSYYAVTHSPIFSGGYYKFSAPYLKGLPIRRIDFSNSADRRAHDDIVSLVRRVMSATEKAGRASRPQDRELHYRQATEFDGQIDRAVYALYKLSSKQIDLVERNHGQVLAPAATA